MMMKRRRAVGAVLATLFAVAGALSNAALVVAAGPSVGTPTASVVFLKAITFAANATLTPDVVRIEALVDVEGATRSIVGDVPTPTSTGSTRLTWAFDTPGGSLLPNTDVTARFRLTLRDGTTVVGAPTTVHYDDTRFTWKTVKGDFVTVHWVDGGQSFGLRAMTIGDDAVRAVSALLGVTERDPIDFYVYGDRTAFYDVLGPGARENVGGEAHPDIRTLFANIAPNAVDDPWVGIVIPHELTHLVFDSAVRNAYSYPPRWLNEGIAVYLSQGYDASDRSAVRSAAGDGSLMPLRALSSQFPTTQARFYLAYSESVAATSYLVDTYGRDAMVKLVRSYAGGVSDDEAFTAALGVDVAGFEAAWLASIGAATPQPFGPQPAPAGPVPQAWGGPAATPGTAPDGSAEPSRDPGTGSGSPLGDSGSPGSVLAAAGIALAIVVVAAAWAWRRSARRNAEARAASLAAASRTAALLSTLEADAHPGVTDEGAAVPGGPTDPPTDPPDDPPTDPRVLFGDPSDPPVDAPTDPPSDRASDADSRAPS